MWVGSLGSPRNRRVDLTTGRHGEPRRREFTRSGRSIVAKNRRVRPGCEWNLVRLANALGPRVRRLRAGNMRRAVRPKDPPDLSNSFLRGPPWLSVVKKGASGSRVGCRALMSLAWPPPSIIRDDVAGVVAQASPRGPSRRSREENGSGLLCSESSPGTRGSVDRLGFSTRPLRPKGSMNVGGYSVQPGGRNQAGRRPALRRLQRRRE